MDEWATIEFLFKTSRGGCWERLDLRGPKSSFLSFISLFFDGRTSTPSQGIFQFHPLSNHRKDTKTSKKNILSSPPLKISEFLLEKSRKSRKIKKKRILWRTKNRENNEIITITGDYPGFISRGKIIRPIIKWHFLKCWDQDRKPNANYESQTWRARL